MKTIRLYGDMGKRFGREFQMDVSTPLEAVRALCYQVKGFRKYLNEHSQSAFKVFVGGRNVSEEAQAPCSDNEVVRIAPAIQGASAAGRIVLGIVLLAAAVFTGGVASLAFMQPVLTGMGLSMILGGVVQLLSPTASSDSGSGEPVENKPSYNFNGPINTIAQGHPVPLCYGKMIVGSAVISAGMTTV